MCAFKKLNVFVCSTYCFFCSRFECTFKFIISNNILDQQKMMCGPRESLGVGVDESLAVGLEQINNDLDIREHIVSTCSFTVCHF